MESFMLLLMAVLKYRKFDRKGAALNAVQIAEVLVNKYMKAAA
jgi:hypothetical protein